MAGWPGRFATVLQIEGPTIKHLLMQPGPADQDTLDSCLCATHISGILRENQQENGSMYVKLLKNISAGAAAGIAVVTILPLAAVGMGAAGVITTLGLVVGTGIGAAAAVADTARETPPGSDTEANIISRPYSVLAKKALVWAQKRINGGEK
jgi:hypothetical protein